MTGSFSEDERFEYTMKDPISVNNNVTSFTFSPDGRFLAVAHGRCVEVWKIDDEGVWVSKLKFYVAQGDPSTPTCITWPHVRRLAFGSEKGKVAVIRFNDRNFEARGKSLQVSESAIRQVAFSKSGSTMAVAAGNQEIGVWASQNTNKWAPGMYMEIPYDALAEVTSIGWDLTLQDRLIGSFMHEGIIFWNSTTGEMIGRIGKLGTIPGGFLCPTGKRFAFPNKDNTFDVLDLGSREIFTMEDPDNRACPPIHSSSCNEKPAHVLPARFMHSGEYLLGGGWGKLNIWDINANIRAQHLDLATDSDPLPVIGLSAAGVRKPGGILSNLRIAAAAQGAKIQIWDAKPRDTRGNYCIPAAQEDISPLEELEQEPEQDDVVFARADVFMIAGLAATALALKFRI